MKRRLVSLAIAAVMLTSLGGAVSAGPSNPNAIVASCHGQTVSNLASNGYQPGHSGTNAGTYNKTIKHHCEIYG